MAKASGQGREYETNIGAAGDVVGNHKNRPTQILELRPAHDPRMAEKLRRRPHQRVINREPEPSHRSALRPPRVAITGAPRGGPAQELLDIPYSFRFSKSGLV